MEPEKAKYGHFQKFINVEEEITTESYSIGANVLQLEASFAFLNDHFEEFHQRDKFQIILSFVHRCLKLWIKRGDYLKDDIGILLSNLIQEHCEDQNDINIVIQIVYQVMNSIKYLGANDIRISEEVLRKLIQIVPKIKSRALASNCIACIQKYMEIFPHSSKNLEALWSYIKQQLQIGLNKGLTKDILIDILMQLIDDFQKLQTNFCDEQILICTIQHLLKSDQKNFRKCGYFLLKKVFHYVIVNVNTVARMWLSFDYSQQIEQSWIIYITMLENLEEEQSHLILPSLENLKELVKSKHLPSPWLNILYMRMLTHKNNLVLRWSIEFFLKTFSCSDLCVETLKHLLQATNSNLLFNYEGYYLDMNYIYSFLKGDVISLFTLFSEIQNWKSVPMYIWLDSLNKTQLPKSLTFTEVLHISSCVRNLQNCDIRQETIEVCKELFKEFIEKMSMKEYVTYIETLYNSGDSYAEHETFFSKKSSLIESNLYGSIFQQRFYEIFTNTTWDNQKLLSFLSDIPVEKHGWLKFAPFKLELAECDRSCINNLYKLDLNSLPYCDMAKIISIFKNVLLDSTSYDKHELIECNQAAISFYIYQSSKISLEDDATLCFILNTGVNHYEVLDTFAAKLLDDTQHEINLWLIDELVKYNSEEALECVFRYLCRAYDKSVIIKYASIILKNCNYQFLLDLHKEVNMLKLLTDEWFKELPSQGDKRIEEAFWCNHFQSGNISLGLHCIKQVKHYHDEEFILDLINYHKDITIKKPRYFENSNEHRVKLRIACCVYYSIIRNAEEANTNVLDQMWDIILNENNQLNIIYIYEYILGRKEHREDIILSKLKEARNLTPSQQVSIISVTYTYFQIHNTTSQIKDTMVYTLLSLTMGANFQTRLFAQMSLYKLLKYEFKGKEEWAKITQSIEDATGTKLSQYLNDIRLHITNLSQILFTTNAPFDEVRGFCIFDPKWQCKDHQINRCRRWYLNKFKVTKNEEIISNGAINYQIQRKMNPINGLIEPHNLIVYPVEEKAAEMFLVASLIDKLPNLGGIARTCEVLGIKNLVIDSKMHTEKNDFKNLSMTAEKTLNILEVKPKDLKEFLVLKKLEGFKIVGAEQTCNSENFNSFQFPKKCVLLMGHEKDGIPAPILGLLDNAVEIPQFGQVRSLNVHVTGALFMWEYCKQHLM